MLLDLDTSRSFTLLQKAMLAVRWSFAIALISTSSVTLSTDLEVMSFNIRFDKGNDGINDWNASSNPRKERVFDVIRCHAPDILGVQEAFDNQIADLRTAMPEYGFTGEQAGDADTPGEYSGIFYRSSRFIMIETDTFWLSDTPDVAGSHYPEAIGASSIRSATWVKLKDLRTARTYFVLNTHWYSNSGESRRKAAELIRNRIETHAAGLPTIVLGDLNAKEQHDAYHTLCGCVASDSVRLLDSYRQVHPSRQSDESTFHSFTGHGTSSRVDYVLHCDAFETMAATIERENKKGSYPSDHYPVTASLHVATDVKLHIHAVFPVGETTHSPHGRDSVDDPAIWIDHDSPANSFIIGADKSHNGRLELYNIVNAEGLVDGSRFATAGSGKYNNVDLRYGFQLGNSKVDLVAASNRRSNTISIFKVDPVKRCLAEITGDTNIGAEPYGLSLYRGTDDLYAFVSECKNPVIRQYRLDDGGAGRVNAVLVRTISMDNVVEGMVADDQNNVIYIAEEDGGIYRFDANPLARETTKRDGIVVDLVGKGRLAADVEGLALFRSSNGNRYLIASSQGDSYFAVYDCARSNDFIARFKVDDNSDLGIGGASLTDGLDVTSTAFGNTFLKGILVVMSDNKGDVGDNLKLVSWQRVAELIEKHSRQLASSSTPQAARQTATTADSKRIPLKAHTHQNEIEAFSKEAPNEMSPFSLTDTSDDKG